MKTQTTQTTQRKFNLEQELATNNFGINSGETNHKKRIQSMLKYYEEQVKGKQGGEVRHAK